MDRYTSYSMLKDLEGIKSPKIDAILDEYKQQERRKNELIEQEECYRMETWKKLHNKYKL